MARKGYLKWIVLGAIACVAAVYVVFFLPNPPAPARSAEVQLIVPRGATLNDIADSLSSHDLIRSRLSFKLAARLLRSSAKIQAGSYLIAYGLSNTAIISRLTGREFAIVFEITIPEGSHIRRIASIAHAKLGLDSVRIVTIAEDSVFLKSLKLSPVAQTAEGYLFPDTYKFYVSLAPEELLRRMHTRWKEVMHDSLLIRMRSLGLNVHQLMTFASIVEAEAQAPEERDTIAGLYWNRLRSGMKLDADPTIKYGLKLDRPVTAADLRIEHRYNTYLHAGLPPGPINNPGFASIKAVLYPAKHNKIYFVSRGDGSGRHFFSANIREHQQRIAESNRNNNRLP